MCECARVQSNALQGVGVHKPYIKHIPHWLFLLLSFLPLFTLFSSLSLFNVSTTMKDQGHQELLMQAPFRFAAVPVSVGMMNFALHHSRILEAFCAQYEWSRAVLLSLVGCLVSLFVGWNHVRTPLMFMYSCFFKPLGKHGDQQSRLESFYKDQAKSNVSPLCTAQNVKTKTFPFFPFDSLR